MNASFGLVAAALVVAASVTTPARAQQWSSEARESFSRGSEELRADAPDYEEAYRDFRLAYEQSRDYRVLVNLGHAAEALERDGEAVQAYSEYLTRGGAEIAEAERSAIERALRSLQANIGSVTLTSSIADLAVIDSRVGSDAPPQVYRLENGRLELDLRAGTHLLTATNGADRLEWQVTVAPGSSAEHRFEFSREHRERGIELGPPSNEPRADGTLRLVAITAAGIGSAALVAGAVTGLLVLAKEEDARALCRQPPGRGTECPESARDDFESARSLATVTNVLFVSGGVLAMAGVGTWLLSGPKSKQSAGLRIHPAVSTRSTLVSVSGSF